jgi:hypothetical protein
MLNKPQFYILVEALSADMLRHQLICTSSQNYEFAWFSRFGELALSVTGALFTFSAYQIFQLRQALK